MQDSKNSNKEQRHRNTYQYINTFIKFSSLPTHIRIMLSILNIQIMHSFITIYRTVYPKMKLR